MFTAGFVIGRDDSCDVGIDSHLASRRHVEVVFVEGAWSIRDLDSTNGTFVNGRRVLTYELRDGVKLQLGDDGPVLDISVDEGGTTAAGAESRRGVNRHGEPLRSVGDSPSPTQSTDQPAPRFREYTVGSRSDERSSEFGQARPSRSGGTRAQSDSRHEPSAHASHAGSPDASSSPDSRGTPRTPGSVDAYIEHYFADDGRPAGDHTRMIRQAYVELNKKQRRKYGWVVGAVAVLALALALIVGYQQVAMQRQEAAAAALFLEMKEQALATARFKVVVESTGNAELDEQMAELDRRRRRMAAQYDGYVKELGIYRRLSEEEQVIYDVARIFNESEFEMPAGFVREVRSVIQNYWLGPGRGRFVAGVQRAESMGYTPMIIETMQRYGLPPEFFYLALQESDFDPDISGPRTRWGIAKGMWQFIPSTARRFGLVVGPREDVRVFDPQDERHDIERATEAAAKYLLEIYSTLAQASGLLVIASYNWGEHRVVDKLESLPGPQAIPEEAFEGIPETPRERNYWRFLGEYSDRMPDETKDYVLKIFAAAVIGQNPRLFGFDFDNVLQPYMEDPA